MSDAGAVKPRAPVDPKAPKFLRALYCEQCGQGVNGSQGAALAPAIAGEFRQAHRAHDLLAYRGPIGGDLPMLTDTWDVEPLEARRSWWATLKGWLFGAREDADAR